MHSRARNLIGLLFLFTGLAAAQIYNPGTGGGGGGVSSVGLNINGSSSSGIFAVTGSPVTVSGTLNYNLTGTSGGVPYFSSGSVLSTSAALGSTCLVLGGGAGSAPATGNCDFTFATHTLTGGASGILDLTALPVASFKFPSASTTGLVRVTTTTGAISSAELSGDATTSGSNAVTVSGVNGASIPTSKAIVGTNISNQLIDASTANLSTLTGVTSTGTVDFSGATVSKLRVAVGLTTAANGTIGYDSTNSMWHVYQNGADSYLFGGPVSGSYTNGNCVKLGVTANIITLVDSGSGCNAGSVTGSGLTVNNMLAGNANSAIKLADSSGLTYTMGAITTDVNPLALTWTTNNAATTFSGLKMVVTNTAQHSGTFNYQFCGGANCFTIDPSANLVTPGSLTVSAGSSVAGIIALGGGTQASITTNSLTLSTQGSSAMTGYNLNYPAAAASGILNWTNNTNQVNAAFLTSAANGDVIAGNGSGWAKLAGNASGTKCLTEDASGNSSWGTCGGAAALSGITAAIASNTIANGNNGLQIWNWAATTNQNQFQFGETTAATNGTLGSQYILSAKTLAGSTAVPLAVIGSLTGTQTLPTLHITPTWNTSGVVDAAILVNVTNSASGAASKLADFQVGAVSQWNADKAGVSTQLGNANAPAFVATGTTAGFVDFPQGSTSTGTSPCNTATSICEQAPAAVTSYSITKPGSAPNIASFKQTDGCGSSNCTESFRISPNVLTVASDFTTAANTSLQTITGLSVTMPASTSGTAIFHCAYNWSQATAPVAVAFGIQGATTAPTRIEANATSFSNTTAETTGTLDNLTTTTATNIVSVAPSAITTIWKAVVDGTLEFPSNASPTVLNFMVSTATSGDAVTVKRGSYCKVDYK